MTTQLNPPCKVGSLAMFTAMRLGSSSVLSVY